MALKDPLTSQVNKQLAKTANFGLADIFVQEKFWGFKRSNDLCLDLT